MKLTNLIILGMTTNFVNPSYPGTDSTTGECKFYLVLNSDVCQVSLAELFFENIAMCDSGSSGLCWHLDASSCGGKMLPAESQRGRNSLATWSVSILWQKLGSTLLHWSCQIRCILNFRTRRGCPPRDQWLSLTRLNYFAL